MPTELSTDNYINLPGGFSRNLLKIEFLDLTVFKMVIHNIFLPMINKLTIVISYSATLRFF